MATTSVSSKRIAETIGEPLERVVLLQRRLREAGRYSRSGIGGGRIAAHVTASDLTNLLLGFAAQQPSDAAEIVTDLSAYRLEDAR